MQSFGHRTVIWSQNSHLVTKQSFGHNRNYKSNQKTSLTKVVSFDIRINNMQWKDKTIQ